LDSITEFIRPGINEADLVRQCDELQRKAGVDDYWYKSLPALVLAGDHTSLAIEKIYRDAMNARCINKDI